MPSRSRHEHARSFGAFHALPRLALQVQFLAGVRCRRIAPLLAARLVTSIDTHRRGHFLTFETPEPAAIHRRLLDRNIVTDVRGDRIRVGFGAYHTTADVELAADGVAAALAG